MIGEANIAQEQIVSPSLRDANTLLRHYSDFCGYDWLAMNSQALKLGKCLSSV